MVEDAAPGYGWSWDDLPYGYATPGGALQHRDNVAVLAVHPGSVAGEDAAIEVGPPASGVRVVNRVETVSSDGETELTLKRMPDGALEVLGAVPASAAPVYRIASVQNPTVFFVRGLKQTLETWGITSPAMRSSSTTSLPRWSTTRSACSRATGHRRCGTSQAPSWGSVGTATPRRCSARWTRTVDHERPRPDGL